MPGTDAERRRFHDRIRDLEADLERARSDFSADPPADERAMELLREGFGPTVALYCEARTGGTMVRFGREEFRTLQRTMNGWLELYAACYGVDIEAAFTIREAAELLIETHNVRDVAQVLTDVPERR